MTNDLIARAQAGDGEAFQALTEPFRRELQLHCYRMLGSLEDAEDALQETLLAAWQGLPSFEARASLRTWLYQIATRRCLNVLRSKKRRPAKAWDVPAIHPPEPTRLGEVAWLEPYPDALLKGTIDAPIGPEARYEQIEAISLAFVIALQLLPARQRAVLILRDVLGYQAGETADMLRTTVDSINSLLKRARGAMRLQLASSGGRAPAPPPNSPVEQMLVAKLVRAFESGDVGTLVNLLTADVKLSMPPIPLEYEGRDAVGRFYAVIMDAGHRYELVRTRANGQLAFGAYLRVPSGGIRHGIGLVVLTLNGDRISAITRFDASVLARFGLPRALPS